MLKKGKTYQEVYDSFQWKVPKYFNIGVDVCDKWAGERYRLALIYEDDKGKVEQYTFWDLKQLSNRLANAFTAYGIKAGDRVGILLPQCPETALSHIALYKIGAVAIPLFTLFGPEALEYRLNNSGARAVITDAANMEKILEIKDRLPELNTLIVSRGERQEGIVDFWRALEKGASSFTPVRTRADDPALIIYTSGTTGPPKGALHAHRVLLGHVPGVEFFHNFFPKKDDLYWTPADWAWIGGLIDVLLPSWHHGVPVVAFRAKKFDPEQAFFFIAKYGIRNAFMPPTALKLMRQVKDPRKRYDYQMRTIGCGGETLGEELLQWGREVMDLTINEFYGQTEVNLVLGNCSEIMENKRGSMGRPIPGHRVEVVGETGEVLPAGQVGEVAIHRPDPVMFLGYFGNPKATEEKFVGDWSLTGDLARKDENGYFWFVGRKDDLISSAGYRIGPAEIEDCLIKHPAVAMAGVIGSPDEVRGEIVKAFIVLKPEAVPDDALKEDIQKFIKTRLAAHEYPREIEFLSELPLTATGKIMRKDLRKMDLEKKRKQKPFNRRRDVDTEKIWKRFQKHMGYTDEEMGIFRSDPEKVKMVTETPDFVKCRVIAEVVEAQGCHAGHKVGDKFVMTAGGQLITEKCPSRMCMFALGPVASVLPAVYERLIAKSDPDFKRSNTVQCTDVGLDKGGWGKILMKVYVERP